MSASRPSSPPLAWARRLAALLAAAACLAGAADPAERLANPVQEARARDLFRETRCPVCQGQSIDDSDAGIAHDLRTVIRAQVSAGRSDGQIRAFLRARYGDFVLLRPPISLANTLLWGSPFLVALAGAVLLVRRAPGPTAAAPLSGEEEDRIATLKRESAF